MKKTNIPLTIGVFMLTVAVLFDLVQVILGIFIIGLILNSYISLVAFLTFYVWMNNYGVSFSSGRQVARLGFTLITELMPFLNIVIPSWTAFVLLNFYSSKKTGAAEKKVRENDSSVGSNDNDERPVANDNEELEEYPRQKVA